MTYILINKVNHFKKVSGIVMKTNVKIVKLLLLLSACLMCLIGTPLFLSRLLHSPFSFFSGIPAVIIYAIAVLLLLREFNREGLKLSSLTFFFLLLLVGMTLFTRISLFPHVSGDFRMFLNDWILHIQNNPGWHVLGEEFANYNMPYLYILFGIGKIFPSSSFLYAVKYVSVLFDYILAYYVMKLVSIHYRKPFILIAAYFSVLMVPSVVLNSAMWAQCDSVFSALAVAVLYYGLIKKSKMCWTFFALAFSFKLQTVFIMPILLVLLFMKKIRLKDVWLFFMVFIAVLIPAVLAGRSPISCLSIYWKQAGDRMELSLHAPNVFAWLPKGTINRNATAAGVMIAGTIVIALLMYLYMRRLRIKQKQIIDAAFLFTVMIPFFLPSMHERYFYLADAVSMVYLYYHPRKWYLAVMVIIPSFLCHLIYLFDGTVIETSVLAFFVLAAVCLSLSDFVGRLESDVQKN